MLINTLEKKMKITLVMGVLMILVSVLMVIVTVIHTNNTIATIGKRIYLIDNNRPLVANVLEGDQTFKTEAIAHIRTFHQLFFTLAPDEKFIKSTLDKAMYLIDDSGQRQRNALQNKGYYNNIISTSSTFTITCDSININTANGDFTYYGKQNIINRNQTVIREIITSGRLLRTLNSENNPLGLLITDYKTISNKDLTKNQYNGF